MNFKELISKRRACKLFNDKKINEKDLHFILESGVLAPSSHGFEPWKFVVLEQKEHNLKLSTLCYNQQNVASASHNIIFLARKDLQSKDEFAQKQVRRFSGSSEENFQKILEIYTHKTNAMNDNELYHYAQLQCYLAMMQMSLAAMSLGIDSCMIGGFEKAKVDDFLNLTYPFETAVILSLGLEPWKFIVMQDEKRKEELSKICNQQKHVKDCAALIIIISRLDFLDYFEEKLRKRDMSETEIQKRLDAYMPFLKSLNQEEKISYAREQAHIALASILYSANALNIASCTIGGFDKQKLNSYLSLDIQKERSSLVVALGYCNDEKNPQKNRFSFDEVVKFI